MLFASPEVSVEAADGVATLWLQFPGRPVNALTPSRWPLLAQAFHAVAARLDLDALVIRSRLPAGFSAGHDPEILPGLTSDSEVSEFARIGQEAVQKLASIPIPTIAFIEGPCLGPGLELALACDYRLAVARPDSWLGFPDWPHGLPPVWGGVARLSSRPATLSILKQGQRLTPREAERIGLIHEAACARRGKILLRSWLDSLQLRPRFPHRRDLSEELARERWTFRHALRNREVQDRLQAQARSQTVPSDWGASRYPITDLPSTVVLLGENRLAGDWAVELSIRGHLAVQIPATPRFRIACDTAFAEALRRGRITPLEADQARSRIRSMTDPRELSHPRLVIVTEQTSLLQTLEANADLRTIFALTGSAIENECERERWVRPSRIIRFFGDPQMMIQIQSDSRTSAETAWTFATWLEPLVPAREYTARPSVGDAARNPVATVARAA